MILHPRNKKGKRPEQSEQMKGRTVSWRKIYLAQLGSGQLSSKLSAFAVDRMFSNVPQDMDSFADLLLGLQEAPFQDPSIH